MNHYQLIIIGGGPGGLEAARFGAQNGLKTALIYNTPIGGRSTWSSLLPSKAWLQIAETVQKAKGHPVLGQTMADKVDLNHDVLRGWIKKTSDEQSTHLRRRLEEAGVALLPGTAQWTGGGKIALQHEAEVSTLSYDHLIVAGGSGPRFQPAVKPNMDRIIAPKLSPALKEIPKSLIMIGGGVTGTEYAFAFASLGTKVTILQKNEQLLPSVDAEVIRAFTEYLTGRLPIEVHTGVAVAAAEQRGAQVVVTDAQGGVYEADYGFIAMGRVPDLSFWPEMPAGLMRTPGGFIQVDRWSRASLPNVYAVGDMTGAPMMANRARSQAREAVRAILGQADDSPAPVTAEAVYTQPNVVQIGTMQPQAGSVFKTLDWSGNLKAAFNDYAPGLIRVHLEETTGRILGAAAFGYQAAEILALVQLAINQGLTWSQLTRTPYAHPSLAEVWNG